MFRIYRQSVTDEEDYGWFTYSGYDKNEANAVLFAADGPSLRDTIAEEIIDRPEYFFQVEQRKVHKVYAWPADYDESLKKLLKRQESQYES